MLLLPPTIGCMYGWVLYADHDVSGCARASGAAPAFAAAAGHGVAGRVWGIVFTAPVFAAAADHGVAGRVWGIVAAFFAVAAAGHGVAVCAPESAAATAAAAAAASNPGGTAV